MGVWKQWSKRYRREVWGYDARVGGRRRQKFGFSTESAALLALSMARVEAFERKAGVAPEPELPGVTVKQLVERRAAQLQETPRRRATAGILRRWLATLPDGLLVTEITTAHLQSYVDARLKSVKQQTVFRELTDISSCLHRARDLFARLEAWTPPRRPRNVSQGRARARLISADEVARLLAYLRRPRGPQEWSGGRRVEWESYVRFRHDAADLLEMALLTAARRSEILSLRWTDINFDWKTLRITGTKTDRVRVIPMSPALADILARRRRESAGSPFVFHVTAGRATLRASTEKIFRAAGKAAGVPYGRDVPGGWVLHDTRHTAITAMLHAGHSLESVMAISGHSARVMAMRYAHATEATRRAAVTALDQFAAGKSSAFSSAHPTKVTTLTNMSRSRKSRGREKSKGKSKKSGKPRAARA
ncbi:MAG TPA: site-specific integrase [Pyrinomonadaceae bacterium]|jgi:integrase|nr:site-specific integrase [Pyrinomonadaceae bacterium]